MGHEQFEQHHEGVTITHTLVKARRVFNSEKDEAQIEISIKSMPRGGKRTQWLLSSLILSPEDARRMALAICPELGEPK